MSGSFVTQQKIVLCLFVSIILNNPIILAYLIEFINFFPLLARISSKYQKIKTVNAY